MLVTNPSGALLALATRAKYEEFVRDARAPEAAFAEVWRETWDEIGASSFWSSRMPGRAAPALADFPITTYEDYRAALGESYESGISMLSRSPILFWAESAASTGPPKVFPLTAPYRLQQQRPIAPLMHSLMRRYPRFLKEKVLYITGPKFGVSSPSGIEVGYISYYSYKHVTPLLRRKYILPIEALASGDTFLEWAPIYAVARDLGAVLCVTPNKLPLLIDALKPRFDRALPYLAGEKRPPAPLPPIRVSRERLARLERAFGRERVSFSEIWPSLLFMNCWKAATCALQVPEVEARLSPPARVIDGIYSATEGWLTVPLWDDRLGGALHPRAHAAEFLKLGDEAEPKNLVAGHQMTKGELYEVFLTTAMGLVRYRLNDVVLCKDFFHRTPVLEFKYKLGNILSLGDVRLNESEISEALLKSRVDLPGQWVFGPGPQGDSLALYAKKGDFGGLPNDEVRRRLEAFENCFFELSREYGIMRRAGWVKPLAVIELPAEHPWWNRAAHGQTKRKVLELSVPEA
jgi:GH3 auxin-responsive promoter